MPQARTLEISKFVGTGNDFIFVDGREAWPEAFQKISRADLAKKICDRHFGVGADGLVIIEADQSGLRWDFYNSDGSTAEMCGNATRCMGRWAERYLQTTHVEFQTLPGKVVAEVKSDVVTSRLDFVRVHFTPIPLENGAPATLVNTGVPHAVVEVANVKQAMDPKDSTTNEMIKALRFHPTTGPKGANVTLLERRGPQQFATVSFERGVEGFTLACGTGVLAAAAVGLGQSGALEAQVEAPGGKLRVTFGPGYQGATLTGPAQFLFETQLSDQFLAR